MARRRFQKGYVFKRGKKRKVWVARWRELLIGDDGKLTFIRKADVMGPVSELTKSDAKQKLVESSKESRRAVRSIRRSRSVISSNSGGNRPFCRHTSPRRESRRSLPSTITSFRNFVNTDLAISAGRMFRLSSASCSTSSSLTQFTGCTAGCGESSAVLSNGTFSRRIRPAESNCPRHEEGSRRSSLRNSSRVWFKDFQSKSGSWSCWQ